VDLYLIFVRNYFEGSCIHIWVDSLKGGDSMSIKQSRDPLLYIMQPAIQYPKATMQEKFVVTNKIVKEQDSPLLNEDAKNKFDSQTEAETIEPVNEETESKMEPAKEKKVYKKGNSTHKKDLISNEVQDIIHNYHLDRSDHEETDVKSTKKQAMYSFNRIKGFKEMTIVEKLNYLENFPKQLPPVPCIFMTKNSSIKGFLQKVTEEMVEIKQFNDKNIEQNMNDLTDIRMIGLK
jgi:Spore coat protein CotO